MKRKKHLKKKNQNKTHLAIIAFIILAISVTYLYIGINQNSVRIISPENKTYPAGIVFISVRSNKGAQSLTSQRDSGEKVVECTECFSFERNDTFFLKGTHTYRIFADTGGKQILKEVVFTVE
jgi:hypothetical protein